MAIGKIVGGIAGLGLVGAGYAGVAGQDDTTRDSTGEVVEGGEVGALRIRNGDCIGDVLTERFEAVNAVPCAQDHKYEVFAAFNIASGSSAAYPGAASINSEAEGGCIDRFVGFVGFPYEQSAYGVSTITPTPESWDQFDDREVLCLVSNYNGTTKQGTAHNSGR